MRVKLWPVLLALNLALAWGLGALWLDEDFDPKNVLWRPPAAIAPASDSLTVYPVSPVPNDLSQLNSTAERPLFWVSRRPPPPPAPEKPAAEQEPDPLADIRLVGLMEGGEQSGVIALTGGRFVRVMVGQSLGAWVLDGIAGRSARFRGVGGDLRSVELRYARQGESDLLAQAREGGNGVSSGGLGDGVAQSASQRRAERQARKAALLSTLKNRVPR